MVSRKISQFQCSKIRAENSFQICPKQLNFCVSRFSITRYHITKDTVVREKTRIVAEANEDENETLQDLIQSVQQRLREYIFVICPNRSAVEDILQETNRVLWEKRSQFEIGTNFLAWARRIAQFQTMSFLKKNSSKSWLFFDSDLVQSLAKSFHERDELASNRTHNLSKCIELLSDSDKELIRLRYELQLSLKEISAKCQRTEGALKQAFLRIRNSLRECVERENHKSK